MKLAVIGGDGIGPEVTEQAIKVLRAVRDDVDLTHFDLGAERYLRTGDIPVSYTHLTLPTIYSV